MTLKDPVKIKSWFAYRNRKMNDIIKQNEVASSFVKNGPTINSDIYLNISKQLYSLNMMNIFKNAVENAYIQQANFQRFVKGLTPFNASFTNRTPPL